MCVRPKRHRLHKRTKVFLQVPGRRPRAPLLGLLHLVVTQTRDKSFTFGRSRGRVNSWYKPRAHASCSPVGGFKSAPGSRFLVHF